MKIRFPDPNVPRPPATPWERWLADGLLQLADDDEDGATEENGVGFNRDDTGDGHEWAEMLLEDGGLTDAGWDWCRENLYKYKRQIGEPPHR